ncbi:MAG: helix-turn-helix domain-containing protein [Methanobacteriota archaeon]
MTLTEVVYKIRSDSYPFCVLTQESTNLKIVLNQTFFDEESRIHKSFVTMLGDEDRLKQAVAALPEVFDSHQILVQAPGQVTVKATATLERLRKSNSPVAFALEYFGEAALFEPSIVKDGYVSTRIIVTRKVDLPNMLSHYERGVKEGRWTDFKLIRIDTYDPEQRVNGVFAEALTQKQLEVIKTAHALGFYNTPRDVTLDDLSSIFGISKAAVHNRLQAAERKVISKFFS